MKKTTRIFTAVITAAMLLCLAACGSAAPAEPTAVENTENEVTFKVGICNYVDDASLNQIVANITERLDEIEEESGVTIEVDVQNCMADSAIMGQIIADFISDEVDLMVGIATPVAMAMQGDTEDNQIPVVFAAVSDPVATGIVESLDAPGANITGTSDYLDTNTVFDLMFAQNPDIENVGLLYDLGQDSSTSAIDAAKAYLDEKNVAYTEGTGNTVEEISMAVASLVDAGVDAIFTPTDNSIMTAELAIYEDIANAGIPHYCGADSFALNGAFLGFGVDYAQLGRDTADIIAAILIDGADPAETAVVLPENGTATINTDICEILDIDYDEIAELLAPYCTNIQPITTAESFEDVE